MRVEGTKNWYGVLLTTFNTAPTLNQYVVSLKDNLAKQVLSQRDLKTQWQSFQQPGFVAISAKADIYSHTRFGEKREAS
jgi:hypothetical protein